MYTEMEMHVKTREQEATVKINFRRFGPRAAIAAANVAFGVSSHATVTHGNMKYRVTGVGDKRRARRI